MGQPFYYPVRFRYQKETMKFFYVTIMSHCQSVVHITYLILDMLDILTTSKHRLLCVNAYVAEVVL